MQPVRLFGVWAIYARSHIFAISFHSSHWLLCQKSISNSRFCEHYFEWCQHVETSASGYVKRDACGGG